MARDSCLRHTAVAVVSQEFIVRGSLRRHERDVETCGAGRIFSFVTLT